MKKLLLFIVFVVAGHMAFAQADSLQQYAGTYKFPEGSPVSETAVTIKNGVLFASSPEGETELAKTEVADVFTVVAYTGLATFKRNEEGKVIAVKIEIGDMVFEGTKNDGSALLAPMRASYGNIAKNK